ncbi:RNA methyltransferase [Halothiobacillus sp. DCM-1]|uniref:RNA methyltransferase n=1 Tax=Halothiobacillus sp. DCM-1 TaxID=3112558 RepID=UPI00324DE92E
MTETPPPATIPIEIILVGTSHPGNLGAVARAMKTMGLERLTLAGARTPLNDEAFANAKHAAEILHNARQVADLPSALQGIHQVFATTARPRSMALPVLSAREAAQTILSAASVAPVAVVFGAERTGLSNEDLSWCHAIIEIPANPAYPVLNLAQAVQILSYELWLGRGGAANGVTTGSSAGEAVAPFSQWQAFEHRLTDLLDQRDFFQRNGEDPVATRARLTEKLRIACHRAGWTEAELALMHGVLTALTRHKEP